VYLYDDTHDSFILISGTMKPYGGNYQYDVDANLHSLLKECLSSNDVITSQEVINGELMRVAITRVDASFQVNAEYEQKVLPDFYPYVFIVRGTSLSEFIPVQKSHLGILIFTMIFEFFVLILTAYLVYRPISKFIQYLDEEKSPKHLKSLRKSRRNRAFGNRNRGGSQNSSEQLSSAVPIPRATEPVEHHG
jgi:hypothetical protein